MATIPRKDARTTDETPVDAAESARRASRARVEKIARGEFRLLDPVTKSRENPRSLRMAVDAMCYQCQGGTEHRRPDAGWQWAIGNCTVSGCALHQLRPYQRKAGGSPEGVYR